MFRVIFFISRRIHNEQNRTRSESNGEEKRTGTFAYEGEEDCIHRSYGSGKRGIDAASFSDSVHAAV